MDRAVLTSASPANTRTAQPQLLEQAVAEGLAHHQAGDLGAAATLYAAVLDLDPDHAPALHLCGVIAFQRGDLCLARKLVARAVQVAPGFAEARNTLGVVLQASGDDTEAQACFEAAVASAPAYPEALKNLGALHARRGNSKAAIACYERALDCGPRGPDLLVMLGIALEAEDRAVDALRHLDEALEASPDHVPGLLARAGALRCLGRYEEACQSFERALRLDPASIEACIGLGTTRLDQLDTEAAIRCFDRGLALDPDCAQLRFNRAMANLVAGRFAEGWQDHGWRWRTPGFDSEQRSFQAPRWDGTGSLDRCTVLVWREQGIADQLLFASLLGDVRTRAAHCICECEPRLVPLLKRSFPDVEFVAAGYPPHPRTAAPEIDFHAPLADFAPLLRPSVECFPSRPAHLCADPERRAHWRSKLAALGPRPKVGFSWRSSNLRGVRALACTTLAQWSTLLMRHPVDWINLQYDRCDDELAASLAATGVPVQRYAELDMLNDLDDTAALISELDLVITAPTAVSALSASLGVSTWHLASGAEWSTMGTSYTPWLPSLRRFYRHWERDWVSVLDEVSTALDQWLDDRIAGG